MWVLSHTSEIIYKVEFTKSVELKFRKYVILYSEEFGEFFFFNFPLSPLFCGSFVRTSSLSSAPLVCEVSRTGKLSPPPYCVYCFMDKTAGGV